MARSSAGLALGENLFDFFHEQVESAVDQRGRPISQEGVFYLTNLLVERGQRPRPVGGPDTLAERLLLARQGGAGEAVRAYREVGDEALVVSGFFRRSLARRIVGLDYYLRMGAAAYARLGSLLRNPGAPRPEDGGHKALDEVFRELAAAFAACSEILREVREMIEDGERSPMSLLELYEDWLETRDPVVEARLRELGLLVLSPPGRRGQG